MRIVYTTAVAVLSTAVYGANVRIPAGSRPGVLSIFQDAFPGEAQELAKHGCWCAFVDENIEGIGGVKPVDYLDDLCRRWFAARRCTQLKDGDCRNDHDDSYVLVTTPWYSCFKNGDICNKATCAIDVHYKDLVEAHLNDLLAAGRFKATPAGGECIPVFPIERPAAPHIAPTTFYCTGEAPDVKRTDFFDDSFEAVKGAVTASQARTDSVRAIESVKSLTVYFYFAPTSALDQWTVWTVDESGDQIRMGTYANDTNANFPSYATWPWMVTQGEDTVFGNYMCGYAGSTSSSRIRFRLTGDECKNF